MKCFRARSIDPASAAVRKILPTTNEVTPPAFRIPSSRSKRVYIKYSAPAVFIINNPITTCFIK